MLERTALSRVCNRLLAGAACTMFFVSFGGAQDYYPAAKHGGNYMYNFYLPPAPSSTPWSPAWSPDGRSLAVAMHGSLWRVEPETGRAVELVRSSRYLSSPDWSPDGKWIIHTADEKMKRIQLEILNVQTGESRRLTDDEHLYLDPVFSPDGNRVAYVSTRPNGYFNLYIREIRDGAWSGPEMALTRDNQYPNDRLYFGAWDMHIQPAWSPDGSEIFFVSNRGVPLGSGHIFRMPARANGIDQARRILQEQTLYRTRPQVSIDGKRIIYSSTRGAADMFSHLYVLPAEGGEPYKMTFGDHDDFSPRWSPDGERIAYISNQGGLPQLVVMDTYGGRKVKVAIRDRQWKEPMGQLEIEVVDSRNGRPTPARIQGLASDGKFYAPPDAYSRVGLFGQHFFHTSGTATLTLPPGKIELTAVKGFEYRPARRTVEVVAGKTTRLRLEVTVLRDLGREGWFSGSTHVHMNYGGNLRNTLENLIFMSKAEDQDIVNELVANKDNRILDWMYFEPGGGEHSVSKKDPNIIVLVGEEYRPPFYGHVFYLGLKENLISPFTTGYEGTGIESLYPSNTDMFRKARAQGAVTGYVHPHSGDSDPLEGGLGGGKSFPVDAALGTIDGYEWSNTSRGQLRVWHHALNNDLKIAPTGGEDSISNLHLSKAVASLRTYAYMGRDFTAEAWLEAVRRGRTFFSGGPLLEFRAGNALPGDSVKLPEGGGRVKLQARVWSNTPLDKIVIHRNGEVFREIPIDPQGWKSAQPLPAASWEEEIQVTESCWFSLYAEGPADPILDINYAQAATNAIRVYTGSQPIRNRASAEYFIRWIDKLRALAEEWPWWRSEQEKAKVYPQFEEARRVYERLRDEAR